MIDIATEKTATAFFGGSFDPPHLGHLAVATAALDSGMCSRVAWVPAYAPPHKLTRRADFRDRAAMVEAMISGIDRMFVSRIEAELALSPSYTIEVLEAWRRLRNETPSLLIGADSLRELHTWHRADELVENFRILTYPRGNRPVTSEELSVHWPPRTVRRLLSGIIPGVFLEISSSELKNRMEKITEPGDIINMKGYLAAEVRDYIIRHGLYIRAPRRETNNQEE